MKFLSKDFRQRIIFVLNLILFLSSLKFPFTGYWCDVWSVVLFSFPALITMFSQFAVPSNMSLIGIFLKFITVLSLSLFPKHIWSYIGRLHLCFRVCITEFNQLTFETFLFFRCVLSWEFWTWSLVMRFAHKQALLLTLNMIRSETQLMLPNYVCLKV